MPSRTIVEGVDIVCYVDDGEIAILVDALLDSLLLQTAEERFGYGVVPTVALATHARFEAIGFAEALPGIASVLRALVRMDHRVPRLSLLHSFQYGIEHELSANRGARGPSDYAARKQVVSSPVK